MRIKIFSVTDSDKHFSSVISEYTKRLGKSVELIDIKPEKNWSKDQIIEKETQKIIEKIEKLDYYKILLSINWNNIDTMWFCEIVKNNLDICFLIWGPYGYDENLLSKYVNYKLSFWKMTFPHWLAKILILEQIYRSDSILKGREYHY